MRSRIYVTRFIRSNNNKSRPLFRLLDFAMDYGMRFYFASFSEYWNEKALKYFLYNRGVKYV